MRSVRVVLLVGMALGLAGGPCRGADQAAIAADEATCKEAGLRTDGPALLAFFRSRTPTASAQAELAAKVRQLGDRSFRIRERASEQLVAAGQLALPLLREALHDPDLEIVRRAERCLQRIEGHSDSPLILAAARLLAVRRPPEATGVVVDYLTAVDDDVVEDELITTLGAIGISEGKPEPRLLAALTDRAPVRRSAAALVLGRSADAAQRKLVQPLLADPQARVRLRAAQGLIDGKDKEGIPVLVALLSEAPPALAWQAEEMLYRIAGEQSPPVSIGAGNDAQRRKCREAWTAWWNGQRHLIDLNKLKLEQRALGLTLIVSLDGYGGQGRVWECGPDTKPRWELRDVGGPIDAQLLPGNRVLVAEYYKQRVTERDLHGKLLWEHACPGGPVACQRLPNGNTLIATNGEIFEVTPQGKRVFAYPSRNGSIFAAERLRNGHLVYVTYEGSLVELDGQQKEVRSFKFERPTDGKITFEVLPGGRYLIPLSVSGKVAEFDGNGNIVWQCSVAKPNSAKRLPNGNVLVCSRQDCRVVEVDRAGKPIWELRQEGHLFRVYRR
jgi:HEAT repeat protein